MEPHIRKEAVPRCGDVLRHVGHLSYPYRCRFAGALGLMSLASLLSLCLPLLLQRCIDGAVGGLDEWSVAGFGFAMMAGYVAQAFAASAANVAAGGAGLAMVRDLRRMLYVHFQRLPLRYFAEHPAGAVLARLTDDVAAIQACVGGPALTAVIDLVTAAAVAGLVAYQSARLFLVVAAFVPVYLIAARWFGRRVRGGSDEVRERLDKIFGHLKEKLDGIVVVRASVRESDEVREFRDRLAAAHGSRLRVARLAATFGQVNLAVGGLGAAAVFAAAAGEVDAGRLTIGGAVAAVMLAGLLFGPLGRATDLAAVVAQAGAGFRRVFGVIEQPACDSMRPVIATASRPPFGEIEFENVAFSYAGGRRAVEDICWTIRPGTKVALVGPTGCGKSTLLSLLLRFYEPASGRILIGGRPLRETDPFAHRRRIGVVPQNVTLFRGTVAENIRWAAADPESAHMSAAARAAGLDEFVRGLPDGYETVIGEGGHRLSHGQGQKVCIARALCNDPDLVLLDESTGSLDPAAEAEVQAAIDRLLTGRTAVVVAHRLGTVTNADQIVVMDVGRIVQTGTHSELLAKCGLYRRLWESQFGFSESAGIPGRLRPRAVPEPVAA